MYYSYVEIEYVATSFSPARMDLALKLLSMTTEMIHREKGAHKFFLACTEWFGLSQLGRDLW
jgi:hypothetical protein